MGLKTGEDRGAEGFGEFGSERGRGRWAWTVVVVFRMIWWIWGR